MVKVHPGNFLTTAWKTIKKNWTAWLLLLPSIFLFTFMIWEPLISTIRLSFYETKGFEAVSFIGLENYKNVFSNSAFLKTLTNTCMYVFWSLIIGYLLPIVVAIMLNEMVHLKSVFRFCCYFPAMVSGMATSLMWKFIFDASDGGILNMLLKAIGLESCQWLQDTNLVIPLIIFTITWRSFGGTMLVYLASLQSIPKDLYEAASLDGAGFFQKVWHIQIPAIKNLMLLMLIRQIIGIFQIMQEPLAMTAGGPNNASMSLMLTSYNYGFKYFQMGRSMATGTITFVILAVLTVIYQVVSKKGQDE